jgi:hypothetical protein
LIQTDYPDSFEFEIKNNILIVRRLDADSGWGYSHSIDICFNSKESVYFFKEHPGENNDWVTSFVTHNNNKILDSRDMEYHNNKGW